jgi:hypothetical protein
LEIVVIELTWFVPVKSVPQTGGDLLATIDRDFPQARPVRFGMGDPPTFWMDREGAAEFEAEWSRRRDSGFFIHWTGRRPFLDGSFAFPDLKTKDEPGLRCGRMQWYLDEAAVQVEPEPLVQAFAAIARDLEAFFGSAYRLEGWELRRNVLLQNVIDGQSSPMAAGPRWLGIPPGNPWLTWFGSAYTNVLGPILADAGSSFGGTLVRRTVAPTGPDDPTNLLAVPEELLARRRDPKFHAVAPSEPASSLPDVEA